jgi:hypothetical protein
MSAFPKRKWSCAVKIFRKAIPLALACTFLGAQQPKLTPKHAPAGGVLSGRIFAVTTGGDVKPAILADLYLFFEVSVHSDGKVNDIDGPGTAGLLYMESKNKATETELAEMQRGTWDEQITCRHDLLVYQEAVVDTLQGITATKQWQVLTGQTDEEGHFKLLIPRQGSWYLVAKGQAGAYDAAWEEEGARIFSGKDSEVKLGSPAKACLKTRDEQTPGASLISGQKSTPC